MKGYIITPLLFIALFLIAASFAIFVNDADSSAGKAIAKEGEIKKTIATNSKLEQTLGTIAYETIYKNNQENEKTGMEQKIGAVLLSRTGLQNTVSLSEPVNGQTGVRITVSSGPLAGTNYDTTVGHPFYDFFQIHKSFSPYFVQYISGFEAIVADKDAYQRNLASKYGYDFEVIVKSAGPPAQSCCATMQCYCFDEFGIRIPCGSVCTTECVSYPIIYNIDISENDNLAAKKFAIAGTTKDYSFKLLSTAGNRDFTETYTNSKSTGNSC